MGGRDTNTGSAKARMFSKLEQSDPWFAKPPLSPEGAERERRTCAPRSCPLKTNLVFTQIDFLRLCSRPVLGEMCRLAVNRAACLVPSRDGPLLYCCIGRF